MGRVLLILVLLAAPAWGGECAKHQIGQPCGSSLPGVGAADPLTTATFLDEFASCVKSDASDIDSERAGIGDLGWSGDADVTATNETGHPGACSFASDSSARFLALLGDSEASGVLSLGGLDTEIWTFTTVVRLDDPLDHLEVAFGIDDNNAGANDTQATLNTGDVMDNNDIAIESNGTPYGGAAWNLLTVAYINPGGTDASTTCDFDGDDAIVVTLSRLSGVITATAQDVVDAINGACFAITASTSTGSGLVEAMTATNLSGGMVAPNAYSFTAIDADSTAHNWTCITRNAGTATSTDSGVEVDDEWHRYTIENDGTETVFSIDGDPVCTHTTNRTAASVGPYFYLNNAPWIAANSLIVDLVYMTMTVDR